METTYESMMNKIVEGINSIEDPGFQYALVWAYDYFELEDFLEMLERPSKNEILQNRLV